MSLISESDFSLHGVSHIAISFSERCRLWSYDTNSQTLSFPAL